MSNEALRSQVSVSLLWHLAASVYSFRIALLFIGKSNINITKNKPCQGEESVIITDIAKTSGKNSS